VAIDFWVDQKKGESVIRAWDKLQLGTLIFPGLATVTAKTSNQYEAVKLNTNPNANQNTTPPKYEPRLFYKGYNLGSLTAQLQVWTPDDWKVLQNYVKQIRPSATDVGGAIDAWDISHPTAALLGIKTVVVTGVGDPVISAQTLTLKIDMMEWAKRGVYYTVHGGGGPTIQPPAPSIDPAGNAK
jgi:hypothetical protein